MRRSASWMWVLLVGALFAVSACGGGSGGGPKCSADSACSGGEVCQDGSCAAPCTRDSCSANQTCAANRCVAACDASTSCANGGLCFLGLCTQKCDTAPNCQVGFSCQTVTDPATSSAIKACLPASGTFVWNGSASTQTDANGVNYLGKVPVPSDAVSFQLEFTTPTPPGSTNYAAYYPLITTLKDPTGATMYSAYPPLVATQVISTWPAVDDSRVPQTPDVPLIHDGLYSYTGYLGKLVIDTSSGKGTINYINDKTMGVSVVYKMAPGATVSSGVLNIRVIILPIASDHPCGQLNAANAPTQLAASIQRIRDAYAQANITIGNVEYVDLDRPDLAAMDGAGISSVNSLMTTSANYPEGSINLFFVSSFNGNPGDGALLGVTGTIPGPYNTTTPRSGIVFSWHDRCIENTDFKNPDGTITDFIGSIMAHEMGHYLGLYHNYELGSDGVTVKVDPINDSPSSVDTQANITATQGNLMFYLNKNGIGLSPGQEFVVRGHPLVH